MDLQSLSFVLIVVMSSGEVKLTQDIKSLQTCEQARSVVLTGNTLEKEAERKLKEATERRRRAEEEERLDTEWNEANPWHDPTTAEEKDLAANKKYSCALEAKDGKVRTSRKPRCSGGSVGYTIIGSSYMSSYMPPAIKYSACAIQIPDELR
jgi:hypothetical protein